MANKLLYGNCGAPTEVLRLTDQLVPAGGNRQSMQANTNGGSRNDNYTPPNTFDMQRLFDELQTFDSVSLAGDFVLQPTVAPPSVGVAPILRAPDVATTLTNTGVNPTRSNEVRTGHPTLVLRSLGSANAQREREQVVERNLAQAMGNGDYAVGGSRLPRELLEDFDRRAVRGHGNSLAERWASDRENSEFWRQLESEFEAQRGRSEPAERTTVTNGSEQPAYNAYQFAQRNPFYSELRSRIAQTGRVATARGNETLIDSLFREALRRFHAGDIPNAVLCFEAVLQVDAAHIDAWHHLATAHALNEDDKRCIQAALKALDLLDVTLPDTRSVQETNAGAKAKSGTESGENPVLLRVLMQLAVAYTNENQHHAALAALKSWIQVHPRYRRFATNVNASSEGSAAPQKASLPGVLGRVSSVDLDWAADMLFNEALATIDVDPFEMDADVLMAGAPADTQLARLLDAFTRCAAADAENVDPDLYCGLGVLYALNADYDRAIDHFRTALHQRPFDGLLWNRLGASLANGGRPEEAIQAYQKALQILPGLIRSRYNLAVAHLNLGHYSLAVQHLVHALRDQRERACQGQVSPQTERTAAESPFAADALWSLLRMALRLDNRTDLNSLCESRDLDALHLRLAESKPAASQPQPQPQPQLQLTPRPQPPVNSNPTSQRITNVNTKQNVHLLPDNEEFV